MASVASEGSYDVSRRSSDVSKLIERHLLSVTFMAILAYRILSAIASVNGNENEFILLAGKCLRNCNDIKEKQNGLFARFVTSVLTSSRNLNVLIEIQSLRNKIILTIFYFLCQIPREFVRN